MSTTTKSYEVGGTIEDCLAAIRTLEATEVHVETNQGTYGAAEACRKVGTGDPAHGNREVYETVGGTRRATGPDEDRAPGRMRRINAETLADYRKQLAAWRRALAAARKVAH
jgi:hypothetical protein